MIKFGDCLFLMKELENNSVNLVVTSPPNYDTIDYNNSIKYSYDEPLPPES